VVAAIPDMAHNAAMAVAGQNGQPDYGRGALSGDLWWQCLPGAQPMPIGGSGWLASVAADPNDDPASPYASTAHAQRDPLAQQYLNMWNNQVLAFFDFGAKMSQYAPLWRSFTCGQLQNLLTEYADSNLPFVIQTELQPGSPLAQSENVMNASFTFLGVVSWGQVPQMSPGVFRSAIAGNSLAYAQVRVFVPTSRLIWMSSGGGGGAAPSIPMGGAPGYQWPSAPSSPAPGGLPTWGPGRQWNAGKGCDPTILGYPTNWDLLNQNWTCQLVPATHPNVPTILQTALPGLGDVSSQDLEQVSYH